MNPQANRRAWRWRLVDTRQYVLFVYLFMEVQSSSETLFLTKNDTVVCVGFKLVFFCHISPFRSKYP
jgi:hypothetical protein